jgi:hypothetical protein
MNSLQEAANRAAQQHTTTTAPAPSAHLVPPAPPAKPKVLSAAEKAWALLDDYVQILPVQFISRFEQIVSEHLGKREPKTLG